VTCVDVERDLDAYVDRELDAKSAAAVRDHLEQCPGCRGRVAERQELGRVLRSLPYRAAPDRLRARIAVPARRSFDVRRYAALAAAAIVLVAIGSTALLIRSRLARTDPMIEEGVAAHVRSLMADHLFDVESTDQHTVKPWFLGRLDFSPPVADLATSGFPLVGGRLDYLGGRPVAALVYRRQKHAINVFVAPAEDGSSTPVESYSLRGFHVRSWSHAGMSFLAVSDLNDAELTQFARALQGS
jgi:anti-sigma factor RsiW